MKPLIFEFQEEPQESELDFSSIEYSHELNLSIHAKTGLPAIEFMSLETETFTKADGEGYDSDSDRFNSLLDTETRTFTNTEEVTTTDKCLKNLTSVLATITATREDSEVSDQDPR